MSYKEKLYCIVYIADGAKYTGSQQFYHFPPGHVCLTSGFLGDSLCFHSHLVSEWIFITSKSVFTAFEACYTFYDERYFQFI